jgi:hypothetical protein
LLEIGKYGSLERPQDLTTQSVDFAKLFSAFIIANYSLNRSYNQLKLGLGIIILPRLGPGNVRLLIWKYLINPYKIWTLPKRKYLNGYFPTYYTN